MCLPRARTSPSKFFFLFFFNDTATTEISTLSLHDALPICSVGMTIRKLWGCVRGGEPGPPGLLRRAHAQLLLVADQRSEEHTSELQSQSNLVCRLLLEKKKRLRLRCIKPSIALYGVSRRPW